MAPLQVILLLLLVRLPRAIVSVEGKAASATPAFLRGSGLLHLPAGYVLLSFILSHLLLTLVVFERTRAALKVLNHPSASTVAVTARTDSLFQYARWATMILTAIHIYILGLPAIILAALTHLGHLGQTPLLAESLYLLPALLCWIGFWAAGHRVEKANRERSLPYRLATGLPAHDTPALAPYLLMHIRHNFYIIVPIALATFLQEISKTLDPIIPHASEIGLLAAFTCLLLMMPWFITHAWNTVPLHGLLRTKLDAISALYRLRFRNILIWKTHNAITNAAILGYLPFSRYFLMTDALLETMTDQQLEGVFAHEVGHGVHRHMWWYLLFMATAILMSGALTALFILHLPWAVAHLGGEDAVDTILSLGLAAGFVALGFPLISHRFEHQADWFAAQHMAREKAAHPDAHPTLAVALIELPTDPPPMPDHGPTIAIPGSALSPAADSSHTHHATPPTSRLQAKIITAPIGAEIFISALDTIADLAHRSRDKKGWMHPSINHRIDLLRRLSANPLERKSFARRMLRARILLAALFLLSVALTAYTSTHESKLTPTTQSAKP